MNVAKPDVVIDKSFLQGASKDILQLLFKNHRILMPHAHFYELMTTNATERAQCFKRIPGIKNPVALVEPVGTILQWEVKNQLPLLNIDQVVLQQSFQFNPELAIEDFNMGEDESRNTEDTKRKVSNLVGDFAIHGSQVTVRFPEIRNFRPGNNPIQIEIIQKRICNNPDFIREFYSSGRLDPTWPLAEHIDERWALFRWLQIRVMAALDYFRKYGEKEMSSKTTKIENEYLDLEYCLIGCLVGSIATRDKGMAERFLALCPSGKIFS